MTGIHIAVGSFAGGGISLPRGGAVRFTTLRSLGRCGGSIGIGIMLRGGGFISVRNIGLTPLSVWTGSLVGRAVGSGVRVVGLTDALLSVWG